MSKRIPDRVIAVAHCRPLAGLIVRPKISTALTWGGYDERLEARMVSARNGSDPDRN